MTEGAAEPRPGAARARSAEPCPSSARASATDTHAGDATRLERFEPSTEWNPQFLDGAPELAPLEGAAALVRRFERWPTVAELDSLLGPMAGVRFEEQAPKKKRKRRSAPIGADSLYDGRITLDGVVPTRARSWHDLMNALVWASFPRAKRALHRRQYDAARRRIGEPRHRLPGARSVEEDALTMLDEGGELWLLAGTERDAAPIDPGGLDALGRAESRGEAARLVFGHALLEHLLAGCRSARPRRLVLPLGAALPDDVDGLREAAERALVAYLETGGA